MWRRLKALVYRRGYRPKYGNPLYSPTLEWHYRYYDVFKEYKKENN